MASKAAIFIGAVFVCLIGICAVSLIFMDKDLVTSNSTPETPIAVEKAIEMTSSAADAQTAISYSPTPLSTATLVPVIISQPTATIFIFQMQTEAQSANTPLPVYETNTPFIYVQPTLVTVPPPSGGESNDACCKHCGPTSKPCGDSCISNSYSCNKPSGCACY